MNLETVSIPVNDDEFVSGILATLMYNCTVGVFAGKDCIMAITRDDR